MLMVAGCTCESCRNHSPIQYAGIISVQPVPHHTWKSPVEIPIVTGSLICSCINVSCNKLLEVSHVLFVGILGSLTVQFPQQYRWVLEFQLFCLIITISIYVERSSWLQLRAYHKSAVFERNLRLLKLNSTAQ